MPGSGGVAGSEGIVGNETMGGGGGGKTGVPVSPGKVPVGLVMPLVVGGCEKFDGPALFSETDFALSVSPGLVSFLEN